MDFLEQVRKPLLVEACRAPNLLADLAGLEEYVAESYNARSFIELLQNADDAGASQFKLHHTGKCLFVANDGAQFTLKDFESLCRSSASHKMRGQSIGYRGIGFKSVVSVANRVHLFSGNLAATFCRNQTRAVVSGSGKVPLLRIPHPVARNEIASVISRVEELRREGMTTIFLFENLVSHSLRTEFEVFDESSLLFLNSIRNIELIGEERKAASIHIRCEEEGYREATIKSQRGCRDWRIHERSNVAIAMEEEDGNPTPLKQAEALVHAFLPTHEFTGLGVKINGDFSTDPSRTKVVMDDRSLDAIATAAELILSLIDKAIANRSIAELSALMPCEDLRLSEFGGPSFQRSLAKALLKQGQARFQHLKLTPIWFTSYRDFQNIASMAELETVGHQLEDFPGLSTFVKSLGASHVSFQDLFPVLAEVKLSVGGAVDVLAVLCELYATGKLGDDEKAKEWRIWPIDGEVVSASALRADPKPLACLPLLRERLGNLSGLRRVATLLVGKDQATVVVPEKEFVGDRGFEPPVVSSPSALIESRIAGDMVPAFGRTTSNGEAVSRPKISKWRLTETQVLEYLASHGWKVTDVSKRNVGYDLEAIHPNGDEYFIEVKLISRVGEAFSLTSNEEVVAREKGSKYVLAIVRMTEKHFEVDFIPDPTRSLELIRQCRQWAWLCDTYPFAPERVEYASA